MWGYGICHIQKLEEQTQRKKRKKKKMAAIKRIHNSNPDEYGDYLKKQALLQEELSGMYTPIDQELIDEAKRKEYLRKNPHLEEDCMKNATDCVTGACEYIKGVCTSIFPKKFTTTPYTPYSKKNNGGKKSRKSHNSKKSRKSKRSHTTYKRSKRSRR